jgi:OOP family OmpA-OmpF porin
MTRFIYIILSIYIYIIGHSQNLVPNGDFEHYNPCPTYLTQINHAIPWVQANQATSDYFNQCATAASLSGVPANNYGYQWPHSGTGYAGLCPWWQNLNSYREYIETPLDSVLSAGACYYFEMYISSGDKCKFNTFEIGAYFSNGSVLSGFSYYMPLSSQINNSAANMPDTASWTLVSGTYTAQGGEDYLVIGNFKDDSHTNSFLANNNAQYTGSYLYVDDVLLKRVTCNTSTGLKEKQTLVLSIYPNPFSNKISISVNDPNLYEIILFDIVGQVIIRQNFTGSVELKTEQLDKGVYFYALSDKNSIVKKGKMLKD